MRSVSPSMQAKLDACVSTFCNCWRLARKDGMVMGFTDHDRDLSFGGVTFRAASGLTTTQVESGLGLGAGSGDILGALQSEGIAESDLANGLYDGATIDVWLVDWSDVDDRLLLDVATIGEVKRSEFAFAAELRSLAHLFDQQRGDYYQRSCRADLGDARCKFDAMRAGFRATGSVVADAGGSITANLASAFEDDFFTGGRLSVVGGANAGARAAIKSHRRSGVDAMIALWTPLAGVIAPGDAIELVAGCDKTASTCQGKFGNIVNFRGFPHMPGNDRVIAYPSSEQPTMDGGSFFR